MCRETRARHRGYLQELKKDGISAHLRASRGAYLKTRRLDGSRVPHSVCRHRHVAPPEGILTLAYRPAVTSRSLRTLCESENDGSFFTRQGIW